MDRVRLIWFLSVGGGLLGILVCYCLGGKDLPVVYRSIFAAWLTVCAVVLLGASAVLHVRAFQRIRKKSGR